jgi:hypothetical protein
VLFDILLLMKAYSSKIAGHMIVKLILSEKYNHLGVPVDDEYKSNQLLTFNYFNSIPNSYIGLSMGSILGAGWVAFAGIHSRAVLVAGGSSFTFLMGRSSAFSLFITFLGFQFYGK